MFENFRHYDGNEYYEHRELHNLYAFLEVNATFNGLKNRSDLRPFVLSRSFFAGAQKYTAVWTGDTKGTWNHLQLNISMIINMCLCGINFVGADIPGFFFDPPEELIVRWYQAGAFFPFMRAHAHHITKRREPWLFSEPIRTLLKQAVHTRYELIPYIYTSFYQFCYNRTWPIVMPIWMAFKDSKTAGLSTIEDEYMFGPCLLVKPVTSPEYELYFLR